MISHLTATCRFPLWGCYIGFNRDAYGDVVIWLGPIYLSWFWSSKGDGDE